MHKKLEKSKPASIHMGFCEVIFILHKMAMLCYAMLSHFSRVQLCVTPWMAAHQAPLSWDSPCKNNGVGCHFLLQCMKVKCESDVAQSCPILCDPVDCSLPGSSVHGILQARILESLPFPIPGDLPHPGIEPMSVTSPALTSGFFPTIATWESPRHTCCCCC